MSFLGVSAPTARVVVLPLPYEATVSWHGGTREGPAAILSASNQVELYDREFGCEVVDRYGIRTVGAAQLPEDPERAVTEIARIVELQSAPGRILAALGGEHTITTGCVQGLVRKLGQPITIVQLDAHCDLRDSYEGSRWSHACVARRLLEIPEVEQILQLGIRSIASEEAELLAGEVCLRSWFAEEVRRGDWQTELTDRVAGRDVYLTIDVDSLDPSIVPATGTPEPDGLSWTEALDILRLVGRASRVVGLDCVELAPRPGLHAADFAVAKLLYKAISYAVLGGVTRTPSEDPA